MRSANVRLYRQLEALNTKLKRIKKRLTHSITVENRSSDSNLDPVFRCFPNDVDRNRTNLNVDFSNPNVIFDCTATV